MNNNIQCSIESSTTKIELNSAVEGVFLVPELEGLAGLPDIRTTSGVNAGYDGGWTSAQNYDARLISIRGVIANPDVSKVEAKRRAIASLLGQGRKEQLTLRFTTEAGNSYVIYVRTISCEMALQRVLTTQEFLIQLRADDPLIYDDGASSGTEAILQVQKALGGFEINFELPLAIGGGAEDTVVENGSETVYPIINLYGPLHSPTVVNRTTNQQMQILADLQYTISWSGYQTKDIGAYDQLNNELDGAPMTLSQLTGNAEQTTYSGKNLANITNIQDKTGYVDVTVANDTITIKNNQNTAGYTNTDAKLSQLCPTLQVGDTVYLFLDTTSSAGSRNGIYIGEYWQKGTAKTITQAMLDANVVMYGGYNETAVISNFMITETNNATYEKYVGGTASPNPDYPQPISTVTGEQTVKVEGKNLLGVSTLFRTGLNWYNRSIGESFSSAFTSTTVTPTSDGFDINVVNAWDGAIFLVPIKTGQSYHISIHASGNGCRSSLYWLDSDKKILRKDGVLNINPLTLETNISVNNGEEYLAIALGAGVAGTVTVIEPQLELGSTATTYEPYQGQEFEINLGKNLCGFGEIALQGYCSASLSDDLELTITPTGLGNPQIRIELLDNLPAGTYTFSSQTSLSNSTQLRTSNNTSVANFGSNRTGTFTTTAVASKIEFNFANPNNTTPFTVDLSTLQIERGSTATDYAPYFTPIELAKIGTYQDRIYPSDGKWYIEKQVGKIVFDGATSEQWAGELYGGYWRANHTFSDIAPIVNNTDFVALSDYFHVSINVLSSQAIGEGDFCQYRNTTQVYFAAPLSVQTSADWRTWLASNPTTVYYALATPTTTEITDDTLLSQLNFIASLYEGVNNISLIGTGAQGQIVVKYATVKTINQDVAVIDSQARTITLNGQDIYHLKTEESEFLLLAPGDNKLYLTSEVSDDSGYAEVKFKQGYLSI